MGNAFLRRSGDRTRAPSRPDFLRRTPWRRPHRDQHAGKGQNVIVLDTGLTTLGGLGAIAPGKRYDVAQILGDRIFLAAADRKGWPFLVFDVSQPKAIVANHLFLPAHRRFIAPYDDTHVLAFGLEPMTKDVGGEDQVVERGPGIPRRVECERYLSRVHASDGRPGLDQLDVL